MAASFVRRASEHLLQPEEQMRHSLDRALAQFDGVLSQVELAARRTRCDWALPIREMANPFELPLPAFQRLRDLARLVALKARLKIAEGRLDEAIQDLRVGFAMARHAGEGGIIVSDLVGVAIADIMLGQLETLIQSPRAMNLYWAVTTLPAPLVDLRDALEVEAVTLYLLFPEFKDVTTRKYSPKQWEAVYDEAEVISKLEAFVALIHGDGSESKEVKEVYRKTLEEGLPAVKRELVERGYSEEELERMPASQVVVLHVSETFEESRDEMFKWFHVPYWQGRQGVEAAQMHMLEGASKQKGGAALAYMMFPALGVCPVTVTRLERRVAALRVLEAVRLYAAAHDGKLPASLDDLVEVPIPDNPFTGKPFGYRLEGDTAVLEAGGPERSRPRQYRVTLTK